MITLRGQILVSRIGDDPPPPCVHPKRFPCLRSKRFRVYWHQAHMFPTCGLGAGTHGDVLNLHTESVLNVCTVFFSRFFTVPQHTKHNNTTTHTHTHTTTTTTPPPQRHTPHNTTRRQKQRETEKERQDKTREDETRQEGKRREEKR